MASRDPLWEITVYLPAGRYFSITSPSSFNVCGMVIARSKRKFSAGTSFGSPYQKPKASPGLGFKFTGCALAQAINLEDSHLLF
ncbi:Uncharacterised protein [Orientia tsutsugamushi]|nr:Uncharacterised protein [Orientia tsutsugamushi]